MSHAGIITESTSIGADLKTLTGDVGGAVAGDLANNIDLLGTAAQGLSFTGTPASHQIQGTIANASDTQKGVASFNVDNFTVTTGDVVLSIGTTGALDNAILRADGIGGLTIQSSGITVNDDDMINIPATAYPNDISGISFGSGNETSIREYWDNQLYFKIDNTDVFYMNSVGFGGVSGGGWVSDQDSASTPSLSFANDKNSGFNYEAGDNFSIIAGGRQAGLIQEVSNIAWVTLYNHFDFDGISSGYSNSENVMRQAGVQTTDAVATQIAAITLASNTMVTVEARFNGFKNDYSASCGGFLQYTARNAGAGAIEVAAPIVNIQEDSAAAPIVDADVSGNDVRLLVTGVAAETWNWTVTYNYNFTQTNA